MNKYLKTGNLSLNLAQANFSLSLSFNVTDNSSMKNNHEPIIFFLPKKALEKSTVIHASCYRLSLSIFRRAEHDPVAVPIESLHCTALLTDSEIFFADNQRTLESDGMKGHPVIISWHLHLAEARDMNEQHIPMKTIFYQEHLEEFQQQLTGEFYKALMLMDQSYRDGPIPTQHIQIESLDKQTG